MAIKRRRFRRELKVQVVREVEAGKPRNQARLEAEAAESEGQQDPDEHCAVNMFWAPNERHWSHLKENHHQLMTGEILNDGIVAIEPGNPSVKGAMVKGYAPSEFDKQSRGQPTDHVIHTQMNHKGRLREDGERSVYAIFLSAPVSSGGKNGPNLSTLTRLIRLSGGKLRPLKVPVHLPRCQSGDLSLRSDNFIKADAGGVGVLPNHRREPNYAVSLPAKTKIILRDIYHQNDRRGVLRSHPYRDFRADLAIVNPPSSDGDWGGGWIPKDSSWKSVGPPAGGPMHLGGRRY